RQWFPIANPTDLPGGRSLAMAFGAPADDFASLSDFIYVGKPGGRMYVTYTGGGVGQVANPAPGSVWKDISAGLSGEVRAIAPNPTRGSREVYAVTTSGVFYMADSNAVGATWVDITGNLFSNQLFRTMFNDPAQVLDNAGTNGAPRTLRVLEA